MNQVNQTIVEPGRARILTWIAPAFLLGLAALFIVAPWSLKVKLDAVCYGI